MFKLKKAYENLVRENHYLKVEVKELQEDYNRVESELKEHKQTSLEDYLKIEESLENCEAVLENEESTHSELKCSYHKLFVKYNILLQKLSKYEEINDNKIVDIEKSNICKLCYESIDDETYKFCCPNNKCKKEYHVECLLKINENKRNECSYCKCDFKHYNYNFNCFDYFSRTFLNEYKDNFSEYSEYDKSDIDYTLNFRRWMSKNYYFNYYEYLDNIIKIQKKIRLFLKKKNKKNNGEQQNNEEIQKVKEIYNYYMNNSISNYNYNEADI